ncbi:VWA domain-containing protein [Marinilongibacter aquaticus]|uniref:vWA domain-containing protein n=1 Tax=Marinilongibacter aquaticus TaxID=2975157 RepID=UPI0021BD7BF9|nr:vWA domain-containing protein [Marinilongibacter aquaticus]UBM59697.1 VWA domain-containing protein [Marinilongibacter aquaticus]
MKLLKNLPFAKGVLFLVPFLFFACNSGKDPGPSGKTFEIYIDFWNTYGTNPKIRFDELNTSREVKIDFSKTFEGVAEGNTFTKVLIDNFRIVDNNANNYNIKDITAYELRDEKWKKDVEFTMSYSQSEDISVVLVLDRSESLGEDFSTIKSYANDFIDKIFSERQSVKMGIVDFADDVKGHPLTSDKEDLKDYVNSLQQGKFTTLYNAMDMGIDMLQDSGSQSKVLFVFTDGTDNNSSPNVDSDYLLGRLQNTKDGISISSFAIGLDGNGGVDKNILTKLSGNGGTSSFPKTVSEAKGVFEKFSKVISTVYSLEYLRNQQIIPREKPAKLKFEITAE